MSNRYSTDGPELVPGPAMQYALLNDSISLICGYNLDSNPQVNIIWTDPSGKAVHSSDGYIQDNGPEIVSLNIMRTSAKDNGRWTCNFGKVELKITLTVVG